MKQNEYYVGILNCKNYTNYKLYSIHISRSKSFVHKVHNCSSYISD